MNTATEVKLEGDHERRSKDRRRGMTLVTRMKRADLKRRFRITVSDELFASSDDARKNGLESRNKIRRHNRVADGSSRKLRSLGVGIAVTGAIILGYLIGRTRD